MTTAIAPSPYFFFDPEALNKILEHHRGSFANAEPFPHVVIDDFLPADVVRQLGEEFPSPDDEHWEVHGPGPTKRRREHHLDKLAQSNDQHFPPFIRHVMSQLLSNTFLHFLEDLTGYENLIPDPSHNQCGLHSTGSGGRLMIHTDFDRHPFADRRILQVLNLILFVTPDWKEEYGGHLELRTAAREKHTDILPIENRAVLFYPGRKSFHGQPEPTTSPLHIRRNSIALYYYCLSDTNSASSGGRQMSVRWVPTVEDDFEYQRKTQERASTLRLRLAGTSLEIPFAKMPCPFPEEWGEVSNVKVDLYDVNGLEGAEREAAIAGLDDMRGQDGLEEMNLIPFGKITPAGGPKGQRPLRLVLLEDGGVSIIPLNNNENMLYITDMMTFSAFCGIRDEE